MPPSAFLDPAARFTGIINGLFRAIGARRDAGFLAGPAAMLLWTRLGQLRERIRRLAARLASGKGPGVPRSRRAQGGTERKPRRPPQLMPRDLGWLIRLVPEAAACGSQLRHLLADPETATLIEAAPQLGRLLRPLCRSLGVAPPPGLRPPPRPPAAASPHAPPSRRVPRAKRPATRRRIPGLPGLILTPLPLTPLRAPPGPAAPA
jgi:hypothetical protein